MASPDELRKKLRGEENIPEEFSWDNMGDQIIEGVDERSELKKRSNRRRIISISMLASCLVLVSTCAYWQLNSDVQEKQKSNIVKIESANEKPEQQKDIYEETEDHRNVKNHTSSFDNSIADSDGSDSDNSVSHNSVSDSYRNQNRNRKGNQNYNRNQNPSPNNVIIPITDGNELIQEEEFLSERVTTSVTESANDQKQEEYSTKEDEAKSIVFHEPLEKNENRIKTHKNPTLPVLTVPVKDLNPIELDKKRLTINLQQPLMLDKSGHTNLPSQWSLGSGVLLWKNLSEHSDSKEKALVSSIHNASYKTAVGRRISLDFGVNYKRYNSVLKDTVMSFRYERRENALISEEINPFYVEPRQVFADTTIEILQTRNIVHYNRYHFVEFPVGVNYSFPLTESMEIGLRIGTTFGLLQSAQGRNTQGGKLVDMSESISEENELLLSGDAGIFVSKRIRDRWIISTQINGSHALNSMKHSDGFEMRPASVSALISVGYTLR